MTKHPIWLTPFECKKKTQKNTVTTSDAAQIHMWDTHIYLCFSMESFSCEMIWVIFDRIFSWEQWEAENYY